MGVGNPYTTITEPTFVARFLLDPHTDTLDTVANVDTFVDLPDGCTWALTMFTVDEVSRLLARGKETGEVANGSYFWAVGQLIVPDPGVPAMTAAIRELVRSGEITSVGIPCDDPRPGHQGLWAGFAPSEAQNERVSTDPKAAPRAAGWQDCLSHRTGWWE